MEDNSDSDSDGDDNGYSYSDVFRNPSPKRVFNLNFNNYI